MQPVMVKQLKSLEKENSRLKKLVADQAVRSGEVLAEAVFFFTRHAGIP